MSLAGRMRSSSTVVKTYAAPCPVGRHAPFCTVRQAELKRQRFRWWSEHTMPGWRTAAIYAHAWRDEAGQDDAMGV